MRKKSLGRALPSFSRYRPGGPGAPLGVGVVQAVQEVGRPGQFHLYRPHLELGEALEDAVEDHVGEGAADPVVHVADEGGAADVGIGEVVAGVGAVGGGMHAEGHSQVLGGGP